MSESDKNGDITLVLEKFGNYQKLQYFFSCLPAVFITMININYIFVAGDVNYRCLIPECETISNPANMTPSWYPSIDRCSRPVANGSWSSCELGMWNGVEECDSWVYESNSTVVGELNLACQPWKINLIGTIHSIGMLFSMLVAGWLTDRFGRRPTLLCCAIGGAIGHFKAIAPSYSVYVAIEFLESALSGGTYTAAMVLMIEIGGKKNRLLAGVLFAYAIYLGESMFAVIAMLVPYWKNLIRIIYTPPLLMILLFFFIRESPRWQILNGRLKEAKETIQVAAKMNKVEFKDVEDSELSRTFNVATYEEKEGYGTIFKSKEILKRLLVASVCRFTASFVYYGLMVNSVWLPGNKYTNFLLATVMSFPGELVSLYLMNKVGRKRPLIGGFLVCGVLCVASGYVPGTYKTAKVSLFLIGKLLIAVCFTGAVTYTMELFPTSARGSLLGLCSLFSRLGGMLAPLTPILTTVSPILPSIFFGGSALLSGILLTLTPETKDMPLMDTIDQINIATKITDDERKRVKEDKRKVEGKTNESFVEVNL